jgi:two-component system sensor histidine kinase UhpB
MVVHRKSSEIDKLTETVRRATMLRRPVLIAIVTFAVASAVAVGLWRHLHEQGMQIAQTRIDRRAMQITADLRRDLAATQNVLRGSSGLLAFSPSITPDEWRDYVTRLHLDDTLPAVRALGFAVANGTSAAVSLMTPLPDDAPPPGYDLGGDPVRRASLERAADTGAIALQAIQRDQRTRFELYLPVYKNGAVARRADVAGFVIGVLDADRLFDAVMTGEHHIDLQVFAGAPASPLYTSRTFSDHVPDNAPLFRKTDKLSLGSEQLTLVYSTTDQSLGANDDVATIVLLTGIASSLLMTGIAFLLVRQGAAVSGATARASTHATLNEARMMGIIRSSMEAIVTIDDSQCIVIFNPMAEQLFGCSAMDAIGTSLSRFIPERFRAAHESHVHQFGVTGVSDRQMGKQRVLFGLRTNGEEFPIEASISQISDGSGKLYTVMLRDVTERLKAESALKRSGEELRDLSANLQNIREEEKTRIARELHDDLGQQLTALKMDLSSVEQSLDAQSTTYPGILEQLHRMRRLIDVTVASVRRIAADLRPVMLDDLGVIPAIEWLANDFTNRYGIDVDRHIEPVDIEFNRNGATTVFRIVQEALTNVARHSEAKLVTLTICSDGNHCVLRIEDDGRGATDGETPDRKSFGLLGIRERAHMLGGSVSIETARGKGFAVTVTIPLGAVQQNGARP